MPAPTSQEMVSSLDDNMLRLLVQRLADSEPTKFAHSMLVDHYMFQVNRNKSNPPKTFSQHTSKVDELLNHSHYLSLSGSKQYDAAFDVSDEILACATAIGKEVNVTDSLATKTNAIHALLEIADTVMESSGDCLSSEVRKHQQWDPTIASIIQEIVKNSSEQDRAEMGKNVELAGELQRVYRSWNSEGMSAFDDLPEVLDMMGVVHPSSAQSNVSAAVQTSPALASAFTRLCQLEAIFARIPPASQPPAAEFKQIKETLSAILGDVAQLPREQWQPAFKALHRAALERLGGVHGSFVAMSIAAMPGTLAKFAYDRA